MTPVLLDTHPDGIQARIIEMLQLFNDPALIESQLDLNMGQGLLDLEVYFLLWINGYWVSEVKWWWLALMRCFLLLEWYHEILIGLIIIISFDQSKSNDSRVNQIKV